MSERQALTMDTLARGWIASPIQDGFIHTFGGERWILEDENPVGDGPHLIISLDLNDPRLSSLQSARSDFLPVCSYINSDVWVRPQSYTFASQRRTVFYLNHSDNDVYALPSSLAYENPLPEGIFGLREMTQTELGLTEDDYWKASDTFIGGQSFIRILGPPIWLQGEEVVECTCGESASYFCSIGYEFPEDYGFLGGAPFFIGEGALYFFICFDCTRIEVRSQSS